MLVLGPGEGGRERLEKVLPPGNPQNPARTVKCMMLWESRGRSHLTRSRESGRDFSPETEWMSKD